MAKEPTGRFYQCQIEPKEEENFSFAQIQCWLPENKQQIKGILCVVLHPHGEAGVEFDRPQPWIELANRHDCALVSISFVERNDDQIPWCKATKGSGRALVAALDHLATESQTPELAKAPIVIAGICEAGQFAYEFAAFAPERVRAFYTTGGSKHDLRLVSTVSRVPGLFIAGKDRGDFSIKNMLDLYFVGKKYEAPWIMAAENIVDYDRGKSSRQTIDFLESFLAKMNKSTETDVNSQIYSPANFQCIPSFPWLKNVYSFVSKPLPKLGTVTTVTVQLPPILLESTHSDFD